MLWYCKWRLSHRREQHTLNFIYDNAQTTANHKVISKTAISTRSSRKKLLKIKRPCTEKFKRSLAYVGPLKWNALPEGFHHTLTKAAYKAKVCDWIRDRARAALGWNPDPNIGSGT